MFQGKVQRSTRSATTKSIFPSLRLTGSPCERKWMSTANKLQAPPLVYISGEEMTRYTMELIMDKWVYPYVDTGKWEFFDLSCKSRDDTEDQVLHNAVDAGARIGAIFKEPTITPTEIQKEKLGLKKTWGSPNGAMRRGWNGITISRDTIQIQDVELGYEKPVFFERHAVGGEYSAGWDVVGKGKLKTVFTSNTGEERVVDERTLSDEQNAVVTYHNPLDNVEDLAHHFFSRCLDAGITPFVVTKKTVFKWQEPFWTIMKNVFDSTYKEEFLKAGLLDECGHDLQHLISDAATMQIIRWTKGGFGMAAHNYDGDMLTDEVSQVHRSPGFITSNLIGKNSEDGSLIKEFEASHGTVADMWEQHLRGEETSLNPLGMVEALVGAMKHSAHLQLEHEDSPALKEYIRYAESIRTHVHDCMADGKGTRDLCGPDGLTTEDFVDEVGRRIESTQKAPLVADAKLPRSKSFKPKVSPGFGTPDIDMESIMEMFRDLDTDGNGTIDFEEFSSGLVRLNVAPKKYGFGK